MKTTLATKLAASMMIAAFGASVAPASFAQDTDATQATPGAPASKAQKKAAKKQARAQKNAELSKLNSAGYNPARHDDASYPQDIQNAQKKAGVGAGASQ